ncbi:MAG: oligosaccharide repeat unit polymerase [Bacilli bacterium]|jgi:oligosaccharide repeat unit polymerase|nr:oligosaccharide repeat unit polymerase [Bacilli bacterium]
MEILILLIIFLVSALFLYVFIVKKMSYMNFISEKFWIIVPWLVCLLLYLFGGIDYTYKLNWKSFGYIFLFWACFFGGSFIARKRKKKKVNDCNLFQYSKKVPLKKFFILSLCSIIIYLIYVLSTNNIEFGVSRNLNLNFLTTFLVLISSVSIIIWLYELIYAILNDTRIPLIAYLSAIIYCIPALVISGRDAIIIIILSTFISFLYSGNYAIKVLKKNGKTFKSLKKVLFALTGIILFYFLFLSSNRYGSHMISLFEWSVNCRISPQLVYMTELLGSFGDFALNIIYYYSSQFSKFAFVYEFYNGPYLMGFFQLHYISRRLPTSMGLHYTRVTTSAAELMEGHGVPGLHSLWDTVIGYFIYDFGRVFALPMAAICGYFVGKMRNHFDQKRNIFSIILQVFICVGMFITVEFSPIFNVNWIFPLFWLIILDKLIFKNFWKEK